MPQNIYCPYSIVSTEILKNTCKKVNIPFALQPNFLKFLLKLISKSQVVIRQVVSQQS